MVMPKSYVRPDAPDIGRLPGMCSPRRCAGSPTMAFAAASAEVSAYSSRDPLAGRARSTTRTVPCATAHIVLEPSLSQ